MHFKPKIQTQLESSQVSHLNLKYYLLSSDSFSTSFLKVIIIALLLYIVRVALVIQYTFFCTVGTY